MIGNWLEYFTDFGDSLGFRKIKAHDFLSIHDNPKRVKPIPLTEEILLKCGFEKGCFYHTKPVDFRMKINENYYVLIYFFGSDVSCYVTNMEEYDFQSEISVDIKYLHELQNLISSTKGQELKIEL